MEIWEFKRMYYQKNPNGHWFDQKTLKFFGERESEMRVLKGTCTVKDCLGNEHVAYCVSSRQRPPYGKPFRKYTFFDVDTMEDILVD